MFRIIFLLFAMKAGAQDLAVITLPEKHLTVHRDSVLALGIVARSNTGKELEYEWSKDGKVIADTNRNGFSIPKATSKDAGHYSVTVKSGEESRTFHTHVAVNAKRLPKKAAPRAPAAAPAEKSHCGH